MAINLSGPMGMMLKGMGLDPNEIQAFAMQIGDQLKAYLDSHHRLHLKLDNISAQQMAILKTMEMQGGQTANISPDVESKIIAQFGMQGKYGPQLGGDQTSGNHNA